MKKLLTSICAVVLLSACEKEIPPVEPPTHVTIRYEMECEYCDVRWWVWKLDGSWTGETTVLEGVTKADTTYQMSIEDFQQMVADYPFLYLRGFSVLGKQRVIGTDTIFPEQFMTGRIYQDGVEKLNWTTFNDTTFFSIRNDE